MRIHVFDRRLSTPPPQIVFRRRKRFSDPGTARVGQRGTVRDSTGQPRGTVRDSAGQLSLSLRLPMAATPLF